MLCVKKPTLRANSSQSLRRELECLYARRSAIDALIVSLESYNQSRSKTLVELRKRKTA
jgi:hypothetical protein